MIGQTERGKFVLLLFAAVVAIPLSAGERLTLAEAARRAVARNFGIRAAEAQVDEARREMALPASRRREFVAGVLTGFRDKLRSERVSNEEQGLVWLGDVDLD
ncbi:MAG TPA: hypothetical protein PLN89_08555, partial [Elusimicrobiota bacterium]|nr:hypothetical protein [Elusimicrobiota bacterium]